ncbi:hypothetical protein [Silvanigrella aquatica]|uniref:Uncharacterized protein n=1 Tax=Silvanigrella aquatica TaxID=1915309 RepID=A0A1L4D3W7_9BACT|nr:hypothetical protein [Silvanigrella aquatica]APJ04915.1 hypothetical protein AXG55_13835 [Silvanigrella aquatica]
MLFFANKIKKYYLVFLILFSLLSNKLANSEADKIGKKMIITQTEKETNKDPIHIEGEAEPASLADIPLPEFDYDFDSFDLGYEPKKELISLLERPEELTGMREKDFAQEFQFEK